MKFKGKNQEYLEIISVSADNFSVLKEIRPNELALVWFKSDHNKLKIDNVHYDLHMNDIISLTEFHRVEVLEIHQLLLLKWNRDFFCIVDHDSEVGCKGILYYGASTLPRIHPEPEDLDILDTVIKMFCIEMESRDNLQQEMLQMMLKRLLILCTRIYKLQKSEEISPVQFDIIREYNYLVERHFREKHTVKEYADLLNKSPKTLSNVFKKYGDLTPLQYVQSRILLEAKRLLVYSERNVSEIGFELGFSEVQLFSRFFRNQYGCSPQRFRDREKLTTRKVISSTLSE